MTAVNRYADRSSSDPHFIILHNFFRFIDHLHFFLSIKIIAENIYLRNQIKSNRIMLLSAGGRKDIRSHFPALTMIPHLSVKLVDTFFAGTGNSLISRHDDTLYFCQVINRL